MKRPLVNASQVICFICICVIIYLVTQKSSPEIPPKIEYYLSGHKSIDCHKAKDMNRLQDISDVEVRKDASIFFHETSCRSYKNRKISLVPKQACAVESAARTNPNMDVYLTFSSPGVFNFEGTESDRVLQRLTEYSNIKILHLDMERYMKGTPLEELFSGGKMEKSEYGQSHASDVLRYLTMYKYGGIYMDLDVIVLKSFDSLKPNFAALETPTQVDSGIMGFEQEGPGHQLVTKCIMDLQKNFSTKTFVGNGPGVITRALQQACGVKITTQMINNKNCNYFKVLESELFYPVKWYHWEKYFYPEETEAVVKLAKDSYALHTWNKMSEGVRVPIGMETAYTKYAAEYCPKVFSSCDFLF